MVFALLCATTRTNQTRRYFDDILKTTSDSVEDVMVEADGEWHTTDNKFASPGWRQSHPYAPKTASSQSSNRTFVKTEQSNAWPGAISLLVDSDSDDEEHFVKTALSPSASVQTDPNPTSNHSESRTAANVIDLTLDSDDDEEAHPPPPSPPAAAYHKRKRSEDDGYGDHEHHAIRQRTVPGAPPMSRLNGNNPLYDNHRSASLPTHDGGVYQGYHNPPVTYQQHPQLPALPRLQAPQRQMHMSYPVSPHDVQSAHGRPGTMSPYGFSSYSATSGRSNGSGSGWGGE